MTPATGADMWWPTMETFLLGELVRQRRQREEEKFFEEVLVPAAEVWDEDRTVFKEHLCLLGDSYKPPLLFPDLVPVRADNLSVCPEHSAVSPGGQFFYVNRVLPRGVALKIVQGARKGKVYFTTDVVIPVLGQPAGPVVLMSLTPMEVLTQRTAVRMACGKVLVGGLGLGWLIQKVCAKRSVTSVVVVEQSQSLLDWLVPRIVALWPHAGRVREWLAGDALEAVGMHGKETRYLLDIWDHYHGARRCRKFQELKKSLPHVWGWGAPS